MKHIAVLVETSLASGRSILSGIARYLQEQPDWSIFHPTGSLGAMDSHGLEGWSGDGIIARLASPDLLARVQAHGVPVIDVLGNVPTSPFPLVKSDDRQIGRDTARHFLSQGHRNFAFYGLADERWSRDREAAFLAESTGLERSATALHAQSGSWSEALDRVASWLRAQPKPLALMIASDQFGPLLLEACRREGILVPEEVSIVSVDNDHPFCDLCQPRLSSVEPNHAAIGYRAAQLLDRLLRAPGEPVPPLVEIAPQGLIARPSSDATALTDRNLAKALSFIRAHACEDISVPDVARASGLSRSVLQRRFQTILHQSVSDAILRLKLTRAREMLTHTDLPLLDVALRSGFQYQEYLTRVFKKHLGTTPARYRKANRPEPEHAR